MWLCSIYACFQWYKNYKNPPRDASYSRKQSGTFFPDTVYIAQTVNKIFWKLALS